MNFNECYEIPSKILPIDFIPIEGFWLAYREKPYNDNFRKLQVGIGLGEFGRLPVVTVMQSRDKWNPPTFKGEFPEPYTKAFHCGRLTLWKFKYKDRFKIRKPETIRSTYFSVF